MMLLLLFLKFVCVPILIN